jgi:hypothetical protein
MAANGERQHRQHHDHGCRRGMAGAAPYGACKAAIAELTRT